MERIHRPNLFMLAGQPDNGKTTLSNWMAKTLGCEVLHTDETYKSWVKAHYPAEYTAAKLNIRGHYSRMSLSFCSEWNEHLVRAILKVVKRAHLDCVVEGWLLQHLPDHLRAVIDRHCTAMTVVMRYYAAHVGNDVIKPKGKDYTPTINELLRLMAYKKGIHYMRNDVTYQCFEDIRDFQGTSDSKGKLLALNLPDNLTNVRVLDVGCGTGYFSIRARQRGADVCGVDLRRSNVCTASRLANSVYRLPDIRFYHGDFLDFNEQHNFDYILGVNVLPDFAGIGLEWDFFSHAANFLTTDGCLVLELAVPLDVPDGIRSVPGKVKTPKPLSYLSERTIYELANYYGLTLAYRGRSLPIRGEFRRRVYHFIKR